MVGHAAGAIENGALVEVKEAIGLLEPVQHAGFNPSFGAIFSEIQEHGNQTIELFQLLSMQVVLGNDDIRLARLVACPVGQAHVRGVGVGTFDDQLGGSAAGDSVDQLVLDGGKERFGGGCATVVVAAAGFEQIAQGLVEALFRTADIADATQQLLEVIRALGILEPLVVQKETLDQIL